MTRSAALAATLAAALPALAAAGVRPAWGGTIRVGVPVAPAAVAPGAAARPVDLLVERARSAPLLEVDARGGLFPGALVEVPTAEAGGRAFRLRLRPGLRAQDGRPLGAADLAAHLTALLRPGAPGAWVALPVLGADAVLEGRAAVLAGLQVLSPSELLVTLAFPLPEFPRLLATPAAALPDAGAFAVLPRRAPGDPLRLAASGRGPEGLPFARELELHAVDRRAAARLLERGELDLVLRPEAAGGRAGPALPALTVTVAAVSGRRLGAGAEAVRRALGALDRADLARRFVRGPAAPLATLVPPALLPGRPPAPADPAVAAPPPGRLVLVADASSAEARTLAERIQVKLFDAGLRTAVELVPPERLAARLAAGECDVALVSVTVSASAPALAAGQIAYVTRGPSAARRAMERLAGASPEAALAAADALGRELELVPLVASGLRASLGPGLQGLSPGADGSFDPGDLWLLGGGAAVARDGGAAP